MPACIAARAEGIGANIASDRAVAPALTRPVHFWSLRFFFCQQLQDAPALGFVRGSSQQPLKPREILDVAKSIHRRSSGALFHTWKFIQY